MPVTLGDVLVGILSINDLLGFISKNLLDGKPVDTASLDAQFDVQQIMTKHPITISPDDTLEKAFSILAEGKFQALPVIKNGVLVGIITNKDLVRLYTQLL